MKIEKIIARFSDTGFKLTPQRLAILEFLEGNTGHPTAEEIYKGIKERFPTMSFATVYNTVQTLSDMGELLELDIDPERKHYDPDTRKHHHIICGDCGRIADIFEDYTSVIHVPPAIEKEFIVTGNHVNFSGVCNFCTQSH